MAPHKGTKNFNSAPWTREQDEWIIAQRKPEQGIAPPYSALASGFRVRFGIDRSKGALQQRYSCLEGERKKRAKRTGKKSENTGNQHTHSWSPAEVTRLEEYRSTGEYTAAQIGVRLEQEFGTPRSVTSINSKVHEIRGRKGKPSSKTKKGNENSRSKLEVQPVSGDSRELYEQPLASILAKRGEFVARLMKHQANAIAQYDVAGKYRKMTIDDILGLPAKERGEVNRILSGESKLALPSQLTLVAIPHRGILNPEVSLVLPLYAEDSGKAASTKDLRSALYDLTAAALVGSGDFKFQAGENAKSNWESLLVYKLVAQRQPNYTKIGETITRDLRSEYALSVGIFEDIPFLDAERSA